MQFLQNGAISRICQAAWPLIRYLGFVNQITPSSGYSHAKSSP